VRVTARAIEIFHRGARVGIHQRRYMGPGMARIRSHACFPPALRRVDAGPVPPLAGKIGPNTEGLIAAVLASRRHPEQGFRTCLGILRLYRGVDPERAEAVSAAPWRSARSPARASPLSSPASATGRPRKTALKPRSSITPIYVAPAIYH